MMDIYQAIDEVTNHETDLKKAKARVENPDRFDEVCTVEFWMRFAEIAIKNERKLATALYKLV